MSDTARLLAKLRIVADGDFGSCSVGLSRYNEATEKHDLEEPSLFVNCSDMFEWACADCETVLNEHVLLFEQRMIECNRSHLSRGPGFDLAYACVRRGTNPKNLFTHFTRNNDGGYEPATPEQMSAFDAEKQWWIDRGVKP